MAELLIIIGLSGVIVATLGLMHVASSRGDSAAFFLVPLVSLGQVQRQWHEYCWWALARVAFVLAALLGAALFLIGNKPLLEPAGLGGQTGQVLRGDAMATSTSFVNSSEAALLAVKGEGKPLSGRLHGREFHYNRVALIDGVLSLSQGEGFLPELEVRVLLGWDEEVISERRSLLVTASDEQAPVVHLSWKPQGQDYPETQIFDGGYRMELVLAPLDDDQLAGSLELIMPDSYKSYLVGDFSAFTNQLRYLNGQVDLHFDHEDTLGYVAEQYLQTQFPEGALSSVKAMNVQLRRPQQTGEVLVRVEQTNGAVEERAVAVEKSQVGWAVVPGSMTSRQVVPPRQGSVKLVERSFSDDSPKDTTALPMEQKTFPELIAYQGQKVMLETDSGRKLEGVMRRISVDRLWLEMNVGSGNLERSVSAAEVVSLTLANGQRIEVTSAEASEAVIATAPPAEETKPQQSQYVPAETVIDNATLADYQALVGKEVIISADGMPKRRGVLLSMERDHLTLSVPMGAGTIEYFYDIGSIQRIEEKR